MSDPTPSGSLDPPDWEAFRELAHRAVDDAIDDLATVRDRPVWQPLPEDVVARFHAPLPMSPQDPGAVYQEFRESIVPFGMGNRHPRFSSWYMGAGTAFGALAARSSP